MKDVRQSDVVRKVAACAILTGKLPCDMYGTVRQLEAFSEALYATREFDRILAESENLKDIADALKVKRAAAARFKSVFGTKWPA